MKRNFFYIFFCFLINHSFSQESTVKHRVEPKETLFSIARTYNVSVQDLALKNEAILKNGLQIGAEISLPNKKKTVEGNARIINSETTFHVVEPKETKYSISRKDRKSVV